MRSTPWSLIRNFSFLFGWVIVVVLMVVDNLQNPYNPNLSGTEAYGHNPQGALLQNFILTLIELSILYLVIRPWSFQRSWWRCLGAMTLFVPWTLLMLFLTMHGGGIMRIHFLWLIGINLILITLLLGMLLKMLLNLA